MKVSAKIRCGIVLGAFLVALSPVFNFYSFAATKNELQKQKEALAEQIKQSQEAAAQKKKDAAELQQIVSKLDADISATQSKINSAQSQIVKTQNEITDTQNQIIVKEKELKIEQDNQDEAIRVMYENVNKSTLEVLASSEDISDVVKYGDYLEVLESKIENTISTIEKLKKELSDKKSELEKKKTDLENYKKQQEALRNALSAEEQTKSEVLGWTRQQVTGYQNQITSAQKEIAAINATLVRMDNVGGGSNCGSSGFLVSVNEPVKRGQQLGWQGNSGFSTGSHLHFGVRQNGGYVDPANFLGGVLSWPLNSPRLTQPFGCTEFAQCGNPKGPYGGGPHPGIDLSVRYLSPVSAAEDGVVIYTARSCSGYGNHIMIMGNTGLITLYAHLD